MSWPNSYYNYDPMFQTHIKSATFQIDNDAVYNVTYIPNSWCRVTANATQTLLYPTDSGNNSFALDYNVPSVGVWSIEWCDYPSNSHYYGSDPTLGTTWQTFNPPAGQDHIGQSNPNTPWVIATVVPEPTTLVLLVTALLGFAGFAHVRRRR